MKNSSTKPSNHFWAGLVSTIFFIMFFWGMVSVSGIFCSTDNRCYGLMLLTPFEFILSLLVSYLVVYVGINKYFDKIIIKNNKTRQTKPISMVLGVILGLISIILVSFTFGSFIDTKIFLGNIFLFGLFIFLGFLIMVILPIFWTKVIDSWISR